MIAPLCVVLVREGDDLLQGAWVFPWVWKKNWIRRRWGTIPWEREIFEEKWERLELASLEPCPLHV